MNDDIEESPGSRGRQRYEYEEPSLIDLEDLEGVSGGQTSAEIWPESDWNED